MPFNIKQIRYIKPVEIIPEYTISAQNIFKNFLRLYASYQVLTAEIKQHLVKHIPEERILVAFTNEKITIPEVDQIRYIEKMISRYIEGLGIREYLHKMNTLDWKIIDTFGPQVNYSGASLEALRSSPGEVSLTQNSFTADEIERIIKGDPQKVEAYVIGNYKKESIRQAIAQLIEDVNRNQLDPGYLRCNVYLLIDCSSSMANDNRLQTARYAADIFYRHLLRYFPRDSIKIFKFSFDVEEITPEMISKIEWENITDLASALLNIYNSIDFNILSPRHIYVLTDGMPQDYEHTLEVCGYIKEKNIDFDLIFIKASDEELLYSMANYPHLFCMGSQNISKIYDYSVFKIAEAAGGNVIRVKRLLLLPAAQVALYEHYKAFVTETALEMLNKCVVLN